MKTKPCLSAGILFLALIAIQAPAFGQTPGGRLPRRPVPPGDNTVIRIPGTPKPMAPINSKLLIYAKNGLGTTSTSTVGEFTPQLTASTTVGKEFALEWSRTKAGAAEKANLYIAAPNSTNWLGVKSVIMPAQSITVNIPYTMPNLPAKTYEMLVIGETGNSNRVTVTYNGQGSGGTSVVVQPNPVEAKLPKGKGWSSLRLAVYASFSPLVGVPNEPGYKKAEIALSFDPNSYGRIAPPSAPTHIKTLEVEVWSEPFMNPELITQSKNSPITIMLFKGKWESASPGGDKLGSVTKTIILSRTSNNEVKTQQAVPGVHSPLDWGSALAQTTNASFRLSVNGTPYDPIQKTPKKPWSAAFVPAPSPYAKP